MIETKKKSKVLFALLGMGITFSMFVALPQNIKADEESNATSSQFQVTPSPSMDFEVEFETKINTEINKVNTSKVKDQQLKKTIQTKKQVVSQNKAKAQAEANAATAKIAQENARKRAETKAVTTKKSSTTTTKTPTSNKKKSTTTTKKTYTGGSNVEASVNANIRVKSNLTVSQIDKYLSGTELAGYGSTFKDAEAKYNIHAGFLVGIVANESAFGSSDLAKNKNNLGGLKARSGNYMTFGSYREGIMYIAELLNKSMYQGANTPAEINAIYAGDSAWSEKAVYHWSRI